MKALYLIEKDFQRHHSGRMIGDEMSFIKHTVQFCFVLILLMLNEDQVFSQVSMMNIQGRKTTCLNGKWKAIIDFYDIGVGDWMAIWKDRNPQNNSDFVEYSFDSGLVLDVPGDFNSQLPELKYYESTIWYKKTFACHKIKARRFFLYFGAVNYQAEVFLNNKKIGSHEGGFTPFQFEITNTVNEGQNSLIVRVNNQRRKEGVPGLDFDWLNYGGITRDVLLIETPETYIEDYCIQLQKGSQDLINGWVKLNGNQKQQEIKIQIPEAGIHHSIRTDNEGRADIVFKAAVKRWFPDQPKLYTANLEAETDTIKEEIGFRTIEVKGTEILLNGKSIFLKGINIHEEIPQRKGRAYSESDANMLLNWVKDLGCNFVRLAHYPHNENTVRLADRIGLMVWSEIPVYQGIDFANPQTQTKMNHLVEEMVQRDKNRCSIIIWSMSNETRPSPERNTAVSNLVQHCRMMDSTRLITSALDDIHYDGNVATIDDDVNQNFDILSVNEYLGWYRPWPSGPSNVEWKSNFKKPVVISEFGGEALYGNHDTLQMASTWSEEYQEQLYRDQVSMFKRMPFVRGTCPWIMADFQSPRRMHPVYQNGWNRKGLLSEKGFKKKAWYVMKEFYKQIK